MNKKLILASASPRRRELLAQIGLSPDVYPVDIDETPFDNEIPIAYVARMAKTKAREAAIKYLDNHAANESTLFLASDTSVVIGNRILGKPKDKQDFIGMMRLLSGKAHSVLTAIALCEYSLVDNNISPVSALPIHEQVVSTKVYFKPLHDKEIEQYWASGEPADKAGGYGIQGKAAVFIEQIQGSYSNVVGLPLKETAELLASFGICVSEGWA